MSSILSMTQFLQENPEALDPRRPIDQERHLHQWYASLDWLTQSAYDASQRAISYRNFRVGCAVLAWRPYREALDRWHPAEDPTDYMGIRWRVFKGANLKPAKNVPKVCAEQIAVGAARMAGYTRIIGLVVVGQAQPDDESNLAHRTLHPCGMCRQILGALPEISPETRILTGGIEGENIHREEFSFAELLAIHSKEK